MALTIDLTPQEEAQFADYAQRRGLDPASLAKALLTAPLSEPSALLAEYHALVEQERQTGLTPVQHERLRAVEEELDDLDEATPGAQWMTARMAETSGKLDALLQSVRDLAARRAPT